jgi:hypothetical protein
LIERARGLVTKCLLLNSEVLAPPELPVESLVDLLGDIVPRGASRGQRERDIAALGGDVRRLVIAGRGVRVVRQRRVGTDDRAAVARASGRVLLGRLADLGGRLGR